MTAQRILVPTDFSAYADDALDDAIEKLYSGGRFEEILSEVTRRLLENGTE